MEYLENVKIEIEKTLQKISPEKINFSVEIPELAHGDATSNFCLVASKVLKVSPELVFAKIKDDLESSLKNICDKIEFKNPGFVNFYLKGEIVRNNILGKKIAWWRFWKNSDRLENKYFGKKIIVEHTAINLFKPFTIGHLMNNFTGEFIVRIFGEIGADVVATSFPSDVSLGIAKAIYIIKKDGGLNQKIFGQVDEEIVKYLGETYVRGVAEYKKFEEETDLQSISEIKTIANNLYGQVESEDLEIYNKTKEINIKYFEQMLDNLGSKFDQFIFESEAGEIGKKIVLENSGEIGSGKVFKKSEGAVVYIPLENRKDINTSVFINSENNPTYLAKDIGQMEIKYEKYRPDFSVNVTDNEQIPHFKTLYAASGEIKKEWADLNLHVSHGRMTFKGQKMSSRLGGVPTAEEVINLVEEEVRNKSGEKISDLEDFEKKNLQHEIALSALRISILRSKPGVNIDFDPDKATSFEGDSGPYLCYSHARCASILQKAREKNISGKLNPKFPISNIERRLLQFPYILKISSEEIAPQKLTKYLFELAGEFNAFYADNKILDEKNILQTQHNLFLTLTVKNTLQKGLYILGINAPERM